MLNLRITTTEDNHMVLSTIFTNYYFNFQTGHLTTVGTLHLHTVLYWMLRIHLIFLLIKSVFTCVTEFPTIPLVTATRTHSSHMVTCSPWYTVMAAVSTVLTINATCTCCKTIACFIFIYLCIVQFNLLVVTKKSLFIYLLL